MTVASLADNKINNLGEFDVITLRQFAGNFTNLLNCNLI